MKKFCTIALTLVLTASLFAGCRNRNQPMETTLPTVAPTTQATTVPTTETTRPTTQPTEPSETADNGNGPLSTTETTEGMIGTASTDVTTGEGRSARPMPKN